MNDNSMVDGVDGVDPPVGLLEEHPLLGRRIRGGKWEEQGFATTRLIAAALKDRRWEEAAELARYFVTEAEVCSQLYRQWTDDLRVLLRKQGLTDGDLADAEQEMDALLALPDGSAWEPTRIWDNFDTQVDSFVDATARQDGSATLLLEELVETWRCCHDRDVDHISDLMNQVVLRSGEAAIGPMYNHIMLPWFNVRHSQFDIDQHPWVEALTVNMMVAFDAMRGHLCGPGHRGHVELEELSDRYVIRLHPCGSGGRTTRGDEIKGTPPRMEAPYDWLETKEPAPWRHYKPKEYYTRVGRSKPDDVGSTARGGLPRPCGDAPAAPTPGDDG